jgi:hypothetical protein
MIRRLGVTPMIGDLGDQRKRASRSVRRIARCADHMGLVAGETGFSVADLIRLAEGMPAP